MKIKIINGPNLALLGKREPDIYGNNKLADIMQTAINHGKKLNAEIEAFQSDEEGAIVKYIGNCIGNTDGIIINPAAYTHTSVALRDAIKASALPCVEVHLSNTLARESFRHTSLTAGVCIGQIMGFGSYSYLLALDGLVEYLKNTN